MEKQKKCNEGEMGSGDSDDEFYNVKLPCTPTVASDKPKEKHEVKKVYSPSRTKVKYDYKFDSSSDDEFEITSNRKHYNESIKELSQKNAEDDSGKQKDSLKQTNSLPHNTYKVVEKINEELKIMKNACTNAKFEKSDNIGTNQNITNSSASSPANVSRPQISVVSPMVVVPPMVVPQSSVMNMGSMIVTSPVGVGGQNLVPGHMMGMAGNMLGHASMGGLMATPNSALSNHMIGMNAVSGQMAGVMGVQGNIMGVAGNAMPGQGNSMGLQTSMVSPALGGVNMAIQGNMLRMAATGNNMLQIQRSGSSVMGVQNPNSLIGLTRPPSSVMGIPRPMGISRPPGGMLGMTVPGSGGISNQTGIMVNSGNTVNSSMMSNSGGLVVVGGMMSNVGTSNRVGSTQANVISDSSGVVPSSNIVGLSGASQVHSPARPPVPPPPPPPPLPFAGIRNRLPPPNNIKWQASTSLSGGTLNVEPSLSPTSSPVDRGIGTFDGDELSKEDNDKSLSDRSSLLQTDESPSPPRELPNTFKNDGSFMEMFKKMKDEQKLETSCGQKGADVSDTSAPKKPAAFFSGIVGKRRGGRVLKTGLVKKVKKGNESEEEKHPKDAWSMYMAEVKKYREASCEEEGKTRPLVK